MRCLAVVALMAGCGGNEDDGGMDAWPNPLRVSYTSPDDGDADVLPNREINATFSTEMDASTISGSTFFVMEGANRVPGTIAYDPESRTATFDPDERLSLLGNYEAIITNDVRSASGQRLWDGYRWSFEVREGTWSSPLTADLPQGSSSQPRIATDRLGNSIAVFNQYRSDPMPDVVTSRNTVGMIWWEEETSLDNSASGSAGNPDVVIDDKGVGTVVFREPSAGNRPVARRYEPGVGWGEPATIHDVDGNANGVQLAVDSSGDVTAIWLYATDVLTNRYVAGTGWSASAIPIDNVDGSTGPLPAIGADGAGNVIAVWCQNDGNRNSVYWNRADASGNWGSAELLETNDTEAAVTVHLAVARDGRAVVVYWLAASSGSQFYTRAFDGASWGSETPLPGATSGRGSLAWAPDGTAWFAYESIFDGGGSDIVVRTYSAGAGWSSPTSIETDEFEHATQPDLAIDANGNAIVAWRDGSNLWVNRYVAGDGWRTATKLQPNSSREAHSPAVSMGPHGEAAVVWELYGAGAGTRIYGSAFH